MSENSSLPKKSKYRHESHCLCVSHSPQRHREPFPPGETGAIPACRHLLDGCLMLWEPYCLRLFQDYHLENTVGVKVTQVVKCLLCKHKGLSLSLGIYIKKVGKATHAYKSSTREGQDARNLLVGKLQGQWVILSQKIRWKPYVVAYTFKPQEAEAGRLCEFKGSQGFTVRSCHKDLSIHKHVYTHIPHTQKK